MATVTYTVKAGDTLTAIAKKYDTTVNNLVKLNSIADPDLIYVGQILVISGKQTTTSTTTEPAPADKAVITAFGLQANTDRTIFATWSWNKENTAKYDVRWYYSTGDGVRFIGSEQEVVITNATPQSTYSAPSNATLVKFQVKPISETKKVNDQDVSYWTANWSTEVTYSFSDNPPITPPVPSVTVTDFTLNARVENLEVNADEIQFQIVKDDDVVFKSGIASIITSTASYSCNLNVGHNYKVRCRAKKGYEYSEWSKYSENKATIPSAPSISKCRAESPTSIYLVWKDAVSGTATSYDIEYAIKEEYLGNSNASTVLNSITSTQYTITGLASGDKYFFRVRSVNAQGTSGWSEVQSVTLGSKPVAPTTWSLTTTAIVGDELILYWVHNSEDGSPQEHAEIEIISNEVKKLYAIRNTASEENAINQYKYNTEGLGEGSSVQWRVRTAGITGEYGEWSIQRTIDVYAPPTLYLDITDVRDNLLSTVKSFPFYIKGIAGPASQKPIGYHISVIANSAYETVDGIGNVKMISKGEEIYSRFYDESESLLLEMTPGAIDLENNIAYTVNVTVTMDSGLTCSDYLNFLVSWEDEIYQPNAEITYDKETLAVHIRPYCDYKPIVNYVVLYNQTTKTYTRTSMVIYDRVLGQSIDDAFTEDYDDIVYSGILPTGETVYFCVAEASKGVLIEGVTLSVYRREFDGTFVEIGSNLKNTENTFVTDPHPSLDYARYRIVATSEETGAVSYTDIPGYPIGEKAVIIQWDESWSNFDAYGEDAIDQPAWSGSMLRLPYNIDISDSSTSDVTLVKYIGRSRPVSYYGTHIDSTATWNVDIDRNDKNTLYALRRLSIWMGDVYVREPSGSGYWANISVSFSQTHCELVIPVTLQITRVEGGI